MVATDKSPKDVVVELVFDAFSAMGEFRAGRAKFEELQAGLDRVAGQLSSSPARWPSSSEATMERLRNWDAPSVGDTDFLALLDELRLTFRAVLEREDLG